MSTVALLGGSGAFFSRTLASSYQNGFEREDTPSFRLVAELEIA